MNIILRNALAYALIICAAQGATATPADSTSHDVNELKEIDISNLTPLDAMNTLYRLQSKIKNRW